MAFEETGGHCKPCGKRIILKRKGTNHILHAILSIFTLGFWVIIWIGSTIKFGGWYCSACGSREVQRL